MKQIITLLFLTFSLFGSVAQTIDARLLELNYFESSNALDFTGSQDAFYFSADSEQYGRELWFSDGTSNGTYMVKDIQPGEDGSSVSSLNTVGTTLFFGANDGVHGYELWKTDGTESGTVMVKDIHPYNSSGPGNLTDMNGTLFFTAANDTNGYELWKSDGTETGTVMVKDINPNGSGHPDDLFVFNNILYFIADDGTNGTELWKSDGTEAGTMMVKNIHPFGSGLANGNQFLSLNGNFFFFANDFTNGFELWKSDGTESGTRMVKNINSGSGSSALILKGSSLDNEIIFQASDGINGVELWKSDGTPGGTAMIKDINGSGLSSISNDSPYVHFNDDLYFSADDGVHGEELWKTDGTAAGTVLVKDINEGDSHARVHQVHADQQNNKLLFFAIASDGYDKTLWVSDGSEAGTFELANVTEKSYDVNFFSLNGVTILTGHNDTYGNELWMTDGTIEGTSLFTDLNYARGSAPSKLTNVDGDLFFRARGTESGNQLFKSDGTFEGTGLIKNILPDGNSIADDTQMVAMNGVLYFAAVDGTHGHELWRSDGTEAGTYMLKDTRNGPQGGLLNNNNLQRFTVVDNTLYFNADDGINGIELWTSDGTETGTYMVKNINTGSEYDFSSFASQFISFNNTVYFIALDEAGTGLWTTDGTEAGTNKVMNIDRMVLLSVVNNKLIIVADPLYSANDPREIWVSDGTASGTTYLESSSDNIISDISTRRLFNDELYFVAKNPESFRRALYKTDGTEEGTILLYDAANHPTMPDLDFGPLVPCGDFVYFTLQSNSNNEVELWRTNGNTTEQFADSNTEDFLYFRNLTCYQDQLLYVAESNAQKIWYTNDSLNEAFQLDINIINGPNFEGFDTIHEMGIADEYLYFTATTSTSGEELYVTNFNFSTLGTNDFDTPENRIDQLVHLYPNPADSYYTLEALVNAGINRIELWDLSGKKVQEQTHDSSRRSRLDTQQLSEGLYLVKVFLSNNSVGHLKLMVRH